MNAFRSSAISEWFRVVIHSLEDAKVEIWTQKSTI